MNWFIIIFPMAETLSEWVQFFVQELDELMQLWRGHANRLFYVSVFKCFFVFSLSLLPFLFLNAPLEIKGLLIVCSPCTNTKIVLFVSFCAIPLIDLKNEGIVTEAIDDDDDDHNDDNQLNSGNDNNNNKKNRRRKKQLITV